MLRFFSKRKNLFFLLFLLVLSLAFLARAAEKRGPYSFLDRTALCLLGPPLKFTSFSIKKVCGLWNNYLDLVNLKKEVLCQRKKIGALEVENLLQQGYSKENKRLRHLLAFKKSLSYETLPAEIIGRDPSSWFKTILINKGQTCGIKRGCGVIAPEGIVGTVINVSGSISKILLVTDINSAVDAVVKKSGAKGILEGFGGNNCRLRYVLKSENIEPGDIIVTSGLHGIYPKGVVVGMVSAVDKNTQGFFQFIQIKPSVGFSKLSEILVVLKKEF